MFQVHLHRMQVEMQVVRLDYRVLHPSVEEVLVVHKLQEELVGLHGFPLEISVNLELSDLEAMEQLIHVTILLPAVAAEADTTVVAEAEAIASVQAPLAEGAVVVAHVLSQQVEHVTKG